MKVKHYLAAAALLLTMATAAQAADTDKPMVAYTTAAGEQTPIDFTYLTNSSTAIGKLVDAVTITATGTWTSDQLNGLSYALRPTGGNINDENTTLVTADLSGAVWSGSTMYNVSSLFGYCTALTTVALPAGGTGIETYFSNIFYGCTALQTVTNLDKFTNVTTFSNTFHGCEALKTVTLCPTGSSANATPFNSAFYGCKALTSITHLDKFTKASNFNSLFRNCAALTSVTLPMPFDATKSISFQYAFSDCTALERVANLDKYTNVSSLNNAFQQCYRLTYVKLGSVPGSNTSGTFANTNANCLKYLSTGVTYPNNWTNVIVDGKATGDIRLSDTYGGRICPFYCPEPFDMNGHTMDYVRSWTYATKQGGWNTLYLPFAATAQRRQNAAGAVYSDITPAADGRDGDYLLKALAASPDAGEVVLTNAATVEAYQPYLVALPGKSFGAASLQSYDVRFASATDATIGKTPDLSEQQPLAGSQYSMYGTLQDYQANNLYLLYNDNTSGTITASSFELYEDGGGVHPFRAYIKANNANALSAPRLVIKGGGGTTGIRESVAGASSEEVPAVSYVYSIDGRLLRTVPASEYEQRLDGLERGIYIVNGVKEVVR